MFFRHTIRFYRTTVLSRLADYAATVPTDRCRMGYKVIYITFNPVNGQARELPQTAGHPRAIKDEFFLVCTLSTCSLGLIVRLSRKSEQK